MVVVVVVVVVVVGGGGLILGEVKARPKDIISFSLDYISKSKVQTSNPSSSPIPLDTPARPADFWFNTHTVKMMLVEISFVTGPNLDGTHFAGACNLDANVWYMWGSSLMERCIVWVGPERCKEHGTLVKFIPYKMGKKRWMMEELMHQLIGPWQNFGILLGP